MNKILILIFTMSLTQLTSANDKVTCTYSNYENLGFKAPLSASGPNVEQAFHKVVDTCLKTICTTVHELTQQAVADITTASNEEVEAILRYSGLSEEEISKALKLIAKNDHKEPEDLVCTQPTMSQLLYMDTMCRTSSPLIDCYEVGLELK